MTTHQTRPLEGDRSAEWHHSMFVEFTRRKLEVGEPSPHLAIMGWITRDFSLEDRVYALGCYAATYCLPSAQVIWTLYPAARVRVGRPALLAWLTENWSGIVTRTERRCVRSPQKMMECLCSLVEWMDRDFSALAALPQELSRENYDRVWESVSGIKFFGRYINIRFVEGLRRYCGVPAMLYDIRSVGGWSPKRALAYLYPERAAALLQEGAEGDRLTDRLAYELLAQVCKELPAVNEYVLAAMLCEFKSAFENRKQFVGHTIDQEPDLYDKVQRYWGDAVDRDLLWRARAALFPPEVLGEVSGWQGYRHSLARVLRDHGYVWSDLLHDYAATTDYANPVLR